MYILFIRNNYKIYDFRIKFRNAVGNELKFVVILYTGNQYVVSFNAFLDDRNVTVTLSNLSSTQQTINFVTAVIAYGNTENLIES